MSEFNLRNAANTARAFATVNNQDEKRFAAPTVVRGRLSDLNQQELANTAWAFAKLSGRAAERQL